MSSDMEHPLRPLCTAWLRKLDLALKYKAEKFQKDADQAMTYLNGTNEAIWDLQRAVAGGGKSREVPNPTFQMVLNKVAEVLQLFGPTLYHRNPVVQVNPRTLEIPPDLFAALLPPELIMQYQQQAMMTGQQFNPAMLMPPDNRDAQAKMRSLLLAYYLNYIQVENDKKKHIRSAIDEALVKGLGQLWTEVYTPPSSDRKLIGSYYDTVDNYVADPDAQEDDNVLWVARRCTHPYWEVEREYNLEPGSLKDKGSSSSTQSEGETPTFRDPGYSSANDPDKGATNDLITYWKIYSKMGMGDRLSGVDDELKGAFEEFGDNCFIVVAKGIPYPLNMPSDQFAALLDQADPPVDTLVAMPLEQQAMAAQQAQVAKQQIFDAFQWPIPFWADRDGWPCTPIAFHPQPNCIYPISHITPGMGELQFLHWAFSFLAAKVRTSSRDFIAVVKSAAEELKTKIIEGKDFTLLELEEASGRKIDEIVSFLQHPEMNNDIWQVIAAVSENLDKRLGLSEILYGMASAQSRSATDVNVRSANATVRTDDMANTVEDAVTMVARKEAFAARYVLDANNDVAPIVGPLGAQLWAELVQSSDVEQITAELDYRIEAGSTRKPNKNTRMQQMTEAMQTLGPVLSTFAQMGQVAPWNAMVSDWGEAAEVDASRYMLPPPPPMPPPGPPQQGAPAQ